ncbi:MAG: phosphate acyltransferase PlsX [Phycisphaerales bacterium]|nr:phosphate acyltransferase PlsX [Planctomycetota bacterium]MCH8508909.1 phosphate acyltransferase PlsX [Phycisphaerales bacterium]
MPIRIAIDVMGGDHAPDAVMKGVVDALPLLQPDEHLVLVGDESVIRAHLSERGVSDPRLEIVHTSEVIEMGDSPAQAVRSKADSSIVVMAKLGSKKAENRCDAVISAGNTGACVAAGQMHMRRLPGVHRPGIAVTLPAFHGPVVLCDAGANPEPRPLHLWQYGIMAEVLAQKTLGIKQPRVALMNIGSEEGKGSDLIKGARDLFRRSPDMNFIGFIEGRDLFAGVADVVVTDGFTGNSMLKMAEGLAKSLFEAIAAEILEYDPNLMVQFEPVIKSIYKKNDYHEYGGAPLLGVNGVMMIAHGSSEPRTLKNAVRNALQHVRAHVNDAIVERIAVLAPIGEETVPA